jgi:hypothetical protein
MRCFMFMFLLPSKLRNITLVLASISSSQSPLSLPVQFRISCYRLHVYKHSTCMAAAAVPMLCSLCIPVTNCQYLEQDKTAKCRTNKPVIFAYLFQVLSGFYIILCFIKRGLHFAFQEYLSLSLTLSKKPIILHANSAP